VLETIRDLGLEFQLIFNKGAVMVLPPGINKATGLHAALNQLGLSPHNAVGIGDGENDHAFLDLCECSLAVANSLPMIKEKADFIPAGENGQGVIEIIDLLLASDLHELGSRLRRHEILIGKREDGVEVRLRSYAENVLVLGSPGSGKTTFATAFMEQLTEKRYQFCIIDPEGDYGNLENTVLLGSNQSPPILDEIVRILERPDQNPVVNLLAVPLQDRPQFFRSFLPRIHELRARTGRPHWVLLDEAHHMLPASTDVSALLRRIHNYMIITVTRTRLL
jgi:Cdc6-like AAA superfamily ATPase